MIYSYRHKYGRRNQSNFYVVYKQKRTSRLRFFLCPFLLNINNLVYTREGGGEVLIRIHAPNDSLLLFKRRIITPLPRVTSYSIPSTSQILTRASRRRRSLSRRQTGTEPHERTFDRMVTSALPTTWLTAPPLCSLAPSLEVKIMSFWFFLPVLRFSVLVYIGILLYGCDDAVNEPLLRARRQHQLLTKPLIAEL